MSDDILVPQSHTEVFLAALTGDHEGDLPAPSNRVELYLNKLISQGGASSDELERLAGLIADNAKAISTNTGDITTLKNNVAKLNDHSDDPYGNAIYRLSRPDYLNGTEYIDTGIKLYDDVDKSWTLAIKYRGTVLSPSGLPYVIFACKHDGVMDGLHLRYYMADDDPNLSDNNRGIDINAGSGGLGLNEPDNTGIINRGQSNIVIIVKNASAYSMYINRNTMAYGYSLNYPIDPSLAHDLPLIIGARWSYDGTEVQYKTKMVVEDARIYDSALTDAQVKLLYEELAAM